MVTGEKKTFAIMVFRRCWVASRSSVEGFAPGTQKRFVAGKKEKEKLRLPSQGTTRLKQTI